MCLHIIESSLVEDQYFLFLWRPNIQDLKKLTSFHERKLVANFLEMPMGEDMTKFREPLSMKELIEKTWENWGLGDEKTPKNQFQKIGKN